MPLGQSSTLDRERASETHGQGIQNIATFQKPGLLVLCQGRPARQIATGNYPGASDAVLVVNEDGQQTWERLRDVTVIDSDVLPPSRETLSNVMRQFDRGR